MFDVRDKLPFWLAGSEALRLADAAEAFWARVEAWLNEALAQGNIAVCSTEALAQHARDRGIVRFPGEPLSLWRSRVLHAFLTASGMGTLKGFEAVLAAHGALNVTVLERQPDVAWDVIKVELNPDAISIDTGLLEQLYREWGPLCRRYLITHRVPVPLYPIGAPASEEHHVQTAS